MKNVASTLPTIRLSTAYPLGSPRLIHCSGQAITDLFLLRCGEAFASKNPKVVTMFASRPVGGRVVLDNIGEQIRECLEHAEMTVQEYSRKPATGTEHDMTVLWLSGIELGLNWANSFYGHEGLAMRKLGAFDPARDCGI